VPGYRYGSIINENQRESMAGRMDDKQLNIVKGLPGITPDERNTFDSALINNQYVRSNPQAGQMMAQAAPPPQQPPMPTDRMSGIAQGGGDMFNNMGSRMAGGGIVAFAGEGDSLVDQQRIQAEKDAAAQDAANKAPSKVAQKAIAKEATKEQTRADYLKEQQDMMRSLGVNPDVVGQKGKAYQASLEETQAGISSREDKLDRMAQAEAWLKLTQPTGGKNIAGVAGEALTGYLGKKAANIKTIDELKATTAKAAAEFEAGTRARAAGDIEAANKHFDKASELQNQLKIAQGNNAATLGAASISAASHRAPYDLVAKEKEAVREELRTKLGREPTMTEVIAAYSTASNKTADTTIQGQIETALAKNKTYEMISLQLANPDLDPKQKEKLKAEQKAIYDDIVARISKSGSQTTAQTAEGAPMYATNGKERIVSTDGGKTWNPVKG
jgi:hypothetical protein